jgi:hypothetical protein
MIDAFDIAYVSPGKLVITFTGTVGVSVWIEVDGVVLPTETVATGAEQTVTVGVSDASRPLAILLHEGADMPEPSLPSRDRWGKPLLRWQAAAGAETYIVYHRAPGGSERAIRQVTDIGAAAYEIQLTKELVDGWHFLRVEAVDQYGRQSTRASWVFRVFQPPDAPETVTVTAQGGGVFRIAIA